MENHIKIPIIILTAYLVIVASVIFVYNFQPIEGIASCNYCNESYAWKHKEEWDRGFYEEYKCEFSNVKVYEEEECIDEDGWEYECKKEYCTERR